jgi:hypothetical protein
MTGGKPLEIGGGLGQARGAAFRERTLSRRGFLRAAAGMTGVVLGSGLILPSRAWAAGADPRPIPGGVQPFGDGTEVFHVFAPEQGNEPSTITDLNGMVGVAHIRGAGTSTDTTGEQTRLLFDADMRFMRGEYIGVDGQRYNGTFAFV